MIPNTELRQNPLRISALLMIVFLLSVLILGGCSGSATGKVARGTMGEKVKVEGVAYTVLGADWLESIGDPPDARIPTHRFLQLRIAAVNESSKSADMALLRLIGRDGTEYSELANGAGVREWIGLARTLEPKESRQGVVLFDAPKGVYDLQVADAFYDGESGSAALILIPIRPEGGVPSVSGEIQ